MKSEELMINDWVNLNFDVDYKTGNPIYGYVQVDSINKDGTIDVNCTFDISESMQDGWDLKLIEPIPLTEELLLKNGFKYVMETRSYVLDPTFIEGSGGTFIQIDDSAKLYVIGKTIYCEVSGYARVVSYIHELQHILKICNIKKEIVL